MEPTLTPHPPKNLPIDVYSTCFLFSLLCYVTFCRKRRAGDDPADENELQPLDRVTERARQSFVNEGENASLLFFSTNSV